MKIVDVNPYFFPLRGGIEHRMHDVSKRLAAAGDEVTVVTGQYDPALPTEEKSDGYRIIRLKSRTIRVYNPPYISSSGVKETLESLDPDLVNFNYRWAPSYTRALRHYDGKKVFTYHNMWGEGTGWQHTFSEINDNIFRKTLDTFDHVIAVSEFVRNDLLRRGYAPGFVTAIPSCLGGPVVPGDGSGNFMLSLGRLVRTKGLDVLMEAMKDVPHRLIVCGKGPDAGRLQKAIERNGLQDRVEMRGYVSEEEKSRLMGQCRFFVMPSLHESLGLAAVELMARGRPVVCSDADGLPETVGKGGVIVPKDDPQALAQALNALFEDRSRCESLAAAAVARAQFYDWNLHMPEIRYVYAKVVANEYTAADAHPVESV